MLGAWALCFRTSAGVTDNDQKCILCGVLAAFRTSPVPECCDFCSHPKLDTSGRRREVHAHRVRLTKGRGDILKAWPSPVYCGKTSCGGLIHATESKSPFISPCSPQPPQLGVSRTLTNGPLSANPTVNKPHPFLLFC